MANELDNEWKQLDENLTRTAHTFHTLCWIAVGAYAILLIVCGIREFLYGSTTASIILLASIPFLYPMWKPQYKKAQYYWRRIKDYGTS